MTSPDAKCRICALALRSEQHWTPLNIHMRCLERLIREAEEKRAAEALKDTEKKDG